MLAAATGGLGLCGAAAPPRKPPHRPRRAAPRPAEGRAPPAMANAVTISGDATNACVAGLESLRAAKLRLKLVMMELGVPWRESFVEGWLGLERLFGGEGGGAWGCPGDGGRRDIGFQTEGFRRERGFQTGRRVSNGWRRVWCGPKRRWKRPGVASDAPARAAARRQTAGPAGAPRAYRPLRATPPSSTPPPLPPAACLGHVGALPLADAGPARVGEHGAAHRLERLDQPVARDGGADLLAAGGDAERHLRGGGGGRPQEAGWGVLVSKRVARAWRENSPTAVQQHSARGCAAVRAPSSRGPRDGRAARRAGVTHGSEGRGRAAARARLEGTRPPTFDLSPASSACRATLAARCMSS